MKLEIVFPKLTIFLLLEIIKLKIHFPLVFCHFKYKKENKDTFVIQINLRVGLHEKQRSVKPETFNTHCIAPHFLLCFMGAIICIKTKNKLHTTHDFTWIGDILASIYNALWFNWTFCLTKTVLRPLYFFVLYLVKC